MNKTLQFTISKETKGAIQYKEDGASSNAEAVVGTLYVRKSALEGKVPSTLTVTIVTGD
jgi:hypothetical protein